MRKSVITCIQHLPCMPNEDGDHPVLQVNTHLPPGDMNTFYMDLVDCHKVPLKIGPMLPPDGTPLDPTHLNIGDEISFDVQEGFHKLVLWKDLKIRQRGYSFDNYAKNPYVR